METKKVYTGDRTIDGIRVAVNGTALDPRTDLMTFSDLGFEWTYEGEEPQQLALAILADHLGDPPLALSLSEDFMRTVIAHLNNTWELTNTEIDAAISTINKGKA